MKDFRTLSVWQKAHDLTLAVYRASAGFPKSETYGLTAQIRRASASIPANIAEGCGRHGDAELARFCQMAMSSASELEYHLLLAQDLKLLDEHKHGVLAADVVEVKRMLASLIKTLRKTGRQPAVSREQAHGERTPKAQS